jgi:hypothetical protein
VRATSFVQCPTRTPSIAVIKGSTGEGRD